MATHVYSRKQRPPLWFGTQQLEGSSSSPSLVSQRSPLLPCHTVSRCLMPPRSPTALLSPPGATRPRCRDSAPLTRSLRHHTMSLATPTAAPPGDIRCLALLRSRRHSDNRKEEGAVEAAKGWGNKRDSVWTDGPRLDDKGVGAAAVWWEEAHAPKNRDGGGSRDGGKRPTIHYSRRLGGQGDVPGKN